MGLCRHPHRNHGCHLDVPRRWLNISSLTVLAFILVLGIVVDDAIVVGERIFAWEQKVQARLRLKALSRCSHRYFGVLTTMAHSCNPAHRGQDGRFFSDRLGGRDWPRV